MSTTRNEPRNNDTFDIYQSSLTIIESLSSSNNLVEIKNLSSQALGLISGMYQAGKDNNYSFLPNLLNQIGNILSSILSTHVRTMHSKDPALAIIYANYIHLFIFTEKISSNTQNEKSQIVATIFDLYMKAFYYFKELDCEETGYLHSQFLHHISIQLKLNHSPIVHSKYVKVYLELREVILSSNQYSNSSAKNVKNTLRRIHKADKKSQAYFNAQQVYQLIEHLKTHINLSDIITSLDGIISGHIIPIASNDSDNIYLPTLMQMTENYMVELVDKNLNPAVSIDAKFATIYKLYLRLLIYKNNIFCSRPEEKLLVTQNITKLYNDSIKIFSRLNSNDIWQFRIDYLHFIVSQLRSDPSYFKLFFQLEITLKALIQNRFFKPNRALTE